METPVCINCMNCKTRKGVGVYCKLGCFKAKDISEIILYTPFDFDCEEYIDMG